MSDQLVLDIRSKRKKFIEDWKSSVKVDTSKGANNDRPVVTFPTLEASTSNINPSNISTDRYINTDSTRRFKSRFPITAALLGLHAM